MDAFNEADETFTVTLTGVTLPEGVSLDEDATTATGTIENDDGLTATVKRVADNVPEGDPAEFAVELTGGTSTADVIVSYTWASTGTAGTDYTEPSGLLTITTARFERHHRDRHARTDRCPGSRRDAVRHS